MSPPFAVRATSRYQRLSNKLLKAHPKFEASEKSAYAILSADPYNRTRQHNTKKAGGDSVRRRPVSPFARPLAFPL
jgi:hypothetical protein